MYLHRKRVAAQEVLAVVVVALSFFVCASAEPVCGVLASNINTIETTTWNNQFMAQKFEVTYAVMLSSVSAKIQTSIYSDNNTRPNTLLPGGSLVVPSYVGGGPLLATTFTVNTTATGNADGLYLSKGFYWFVVAAPTIANTVGMYYVAGTIAPNTSLPIAIYNMAVKVNPTQSWTPYPSSNGQFLFSASGCDLTNISSSPSPSNTPVASPSPSNIPSPSVTPSPVPSVSPSPSTTPSPSLSPSPTASSSPTHTATPSPAASASASVSPTRSSSPTRSPIPTPSAKIVALVANVTASFDSTAAAEVQVTAPLTSSDVKSALGVSSQFAGLVVGNATLPASALTSFTRTVRNETDEDAELTTTYVYAARVDNTTQLEQAFTFHATNKSTQFAGTSFTIGSGSIKWSVNLARNSTDDADLSSSGGITMNYRLTGLLGNSSQQQVEASASTTTRSASGMSVRKVPNSPHANMTTYFLSFASSGANDEEEAGCAVELFDVALVDGREVPVPISHEINIVGDTATANAEFELVLHFPAFEQSLVYDPSISLGVLLGGGGHDELGSSGGDDNMGMIIAVAVAVPVAVVIVLVAIAAGTLVIVRRRKREISKFRKSAALSQGL